MLSEFELGHNPRYAKAEAVVFQSINKLKQ